MGVVVFAKAKMMKSCAMSAAYPDFSESLRLALVMQRRHKEEMRIKERKILFRIAPLLAAKAELTPLRTNHETVQDPLFYAPLHKNQMRNC